MITVFLFVRGTTDSPIQDMVAQAQAAAALDTLERLRGISEIAKIVVSTASVQVAERARNLGALVEMDPPGKDFHFGRHLASLIQSYQAQVPLYVGGGSGVLMQPDDWQRLASQILARPGSIIANNYFSADFATWSPGDSITRIDPPAIDNDLAFRLGERAGLQVLMMPKNAATQLDLDTPTDLVTVGFHPGIGSHLGDFLSRSSLNVDRARSIRSLMANPQATLFVAGRVSASVSLFLERQTKCQWRFVSEERGMRASGREERGEVRSLLGLYLDEVGEQGLFDSLAQMANGAIIDTRVLFAHRGLHPAADDRFYSDLLQPDPIQDPFVRAITLAAQRAPIPILLGGHSTVSGGMYSLAEGLISTADHGSID